ncbi:MAG TPA: hypothetical protein PLH20_11060, partial [Flavobacterium sp.]|nr:hypothetical protein [Flavobacterium sp.]
AWKAKHYFFVRRPFAGSTELILLKRTKLFSLVRFKTKKAQTWKPKHCFFMKDPLLCGINAVNPFFSVKDWSIICFRSYPS